MTDRFDGLLYKAGLTAQGCWDEMDDYDRKAILKFAELIVRECVKKSVEICMNRIQGDCWKNNQADIEALRCSQDIQRELPKHFGVEE